MTVELCYHDPGMVGSYESWHVHNTCSGEFFSLTSIPDTYVLGVCLFWQQSVPLWSSLS